MKILQVIHGYPMQYNAGSEVYTQTLCHALADSGHEVHVFTREENSFEPDFTLRQERDVDDDRIVQARQRLVHIDAPGAVPEEPGQSEGSPYAGGEEGDGAAPSTVQLLAGS